MTLYTELVSKVKQMSQAEKLALLRVLADSLGDETPKRKRAKKTVEFQPGRFKPAKDSSLFQVLGALRDENKPAPGDEEVDQIIANYLIKKHA
jgi:hypothetical protein